MKSKIFDKSGKEKGSVDLPKIFSGEIRKDVIAKVFEAQKREQPYGTMYYAGRGYSASGISRKKRHSWKVTYGKGISRGPRKIMSRHGSSFNWVGATAPHARGGARAHPHRPEEVQFRKINKQELQIALSSALLATFDVKAVDKKYSIKVSNSAVVVDDSVVKSKTSEFIQFLETVFPNVQKLFKEKKVRAGQGKRRGRKYKSNAGLLFVISSEEKMNKSGVEVVKAKDLRIADLAPNGKPGRFAVYSEKALKEIAEVWK